MVVLSNVAQICKLLALIWFLQNGYEPVPTLLPTVWSVDLFRLKPHFKLIIQVNSVRLKLHKEYSNEYLTDFCLKVLCLYSGFILSAPIIDSLLPLFGNDSLRNATTIKLVTVLFNGLPLYCKHFAGIPSLPDGLFAIIW